MSREAHVRICESARVKSPRATRPFDAAVDLGFGLIANERFRLARLDAPELGTEEGTAAKAYLVDLMTRSESKVILQVIERDKFRRYVSEVWVRQETETPGPGRLKNINDEILARLAPPTPAR